MNLKDLNTKKFLVIGDVMLDKFWVGDCHRIAPESPNPILNITSKEHVAGGASNVATNIASLTGQVTIIGTIGNDSAGEILSNCISEKGINNKLIRSNNLSTIVKNRLLSQNQQLLRFDEEMSLYSEQTENMLLDKALSLVEEHDVIIISDYDKGTVSEKVAKEIVQLSKKLKKKIIVDSKKVNFACYRGADYITPNISELNKILKSNTDKEAIKSFLKEFDIGYILLTQGKDGMTLISQHGEPWHIMANTKNVYDVTGAGDTVVAAFASCISLDMEPKESVYVANKAAGIVVSKVGTSTVSLQEIEEELQLIHKKDLKGVISRSSLPVLVRTIQKNNQKLVFTNGCFDILHVGHITYLKQAKQLGDKLIVGVNSDASVKRLKGPTRPVLPCNQRMEMLASLSCVDYVVEFDEDTPLEILHEIKPHVLVKGGDYEDVRKLVGYDLIKSYGGSVKILGLVEGMSTTNILNNINNNINEVLA